MNFVDAGTALEKPSCDAVDAKLAQSAMMKGPYLPVGTSTAVAAFVLSLYHLIACTPVGHILASTRIGSYLMVKFPLYRYGVPV